MVMTGWTREELGRQPAPIVAGLFHRIQATRLMPILAEAETQLAKADAIDLTTVPTADRAGVRAERESGAERVALLRAMLGLEPIR